MNRHRTDDRVHRSNNAVGQRFPLSSAVLHFSGQLRRNLSLDCLQWTFLVHSGSGLDFSASCSSARVGVVQGMTSSVGLARATPMPGICRTIASISTFHRHEELPYWSRLLCWGPDGIAPATRSGKNRCQDLNCWDGHDRVQGARRSARTSPEGDHAGALKGLGQMPGTTDVFLGAAAGSIGGTHHTRRQPCPGARFCPPALGHS